MPATAMFESVRDIAGEHSCLFNLVLHCSPPFLWQELCAVILLLALCVKNCCEGSCGEGGHPDGSLEPESQGRQAN